MISDLPADKVCKGYFLLLKVIHESIKMTSVLLPGEDGQGRVINVGIYNASYNFIPKDQWIVVKEPYRKRGNDGLDLIRVDNP